MNRRNLLTGLMGLLAAVGWKPKGDVPPYRVMKVTRERLGIAQHAARAGEPLRVIWATRAKNGDMWACCEMINGEIVHGCTIKSPWDVALHDCIVLSRDGKQAWRPMFSDDRQYITINEARKAVQG